jgi:hypothetical protein
MCLAAFVQSRFIPNHVERKTQQGNPIPPDKVHLQTLKSIGEELDLPWLSWQVLKRSHKIFHGRAQVQLSADLTSVRCYLDEGKQ